MNDSKKTYYIDLPTHQIARDGEFTTWNFQIEAADEDIIKLREYFDIAHQADTDSFYRAHIPYLQYHYDRENDEYDENMRKIYELIYELGSPEVKQFINQEGILETDVPQDEM